MPRAQGSQGYIGIAEQDHRSVPKDPTLYGDIVEVSAKADKEKIAIPILRPGVYQQTAQDVDGKRMAGEGFKTVFHPSDWVFLWKHLLGEVTSSQQGGTSAYKHEITGIDTVYGNGLTVMKHLDQMTMHLFGMFANKATVDLELSQPAFITWEFVGKDGSIGTGTSGTSQGQNAITFPVTLVASTSDQISIAIDGGSAVEVTLTAGAYATGAALATMINGIIADPDNGYTSLLDSHRNPIVACRVDSNDKLNFYSASKGTSSAVAWTAGTNDASLLLGRGTPVETSGNATVSTPVYNSAVGPYIYHQGRLKLDNVETCAQKLSFSVDNQLSPIECLGYDSNTDVVKVTRVISGTITKWLEDATIKQAFENNTDVELDIELRSGVEADTGYNYDCDIIMKAIRYGNPEPGLASKDPIAEEVPFIAYYYDATYKDFYISFINLLTSI
jgi:hypothetical protein